MDTQAQQLQPMVEYSPLAEIEKRAILALVAQAGALKAAKVLGVGKTTIYRKLAEYKRDA
jgi:transcriptional regulator with PAS, ATPase and Fis domain